MAVTYANHNRCPKPYLILLRDVERCYPRAISDSVCDSPIIYNVAFTNVYVKEHNFRNNCRQKESSKTFRGVAQAMAEQWGTFIRSRNVAACL